MIFQTKMDCLQWLLAIFVRTVGISVNNMRSYLLYLSSCSIHSVHLLLLALTRGSIN